MTNEDRATFAAEITRLADAHEVALTPTRIEAYFEALAEFTVGDIAAAMRRSFRLLKWFPKPVELADIIENEVQPSQRRALNAARAAEEARALPEHVYTEEEKLAAKAEFERLIDKLAREMQGKFARRRDHDTRQVVVSLEDAAAHRDRCRDAARLYLRAYGDVQP